MLSLSLSLSLSLEQSCPRSPQRKGFLEDAIIEHRYRCRIIVRKVENRFQAASLDINQQISLCPHVRDDFHTISES
jgi:hypothetical protein